jgi:hypothetical protein
VYKVQKAKRNPQMGAFFRGHRPLAFQFFALCYTTLLWTIYNQLFYNLQRKIILTDLWIETMIKPKR